MHIHIPIFRGTSQAIAIVDCRGNSNDTMSWVCPHALTVYTRGHIIIIKYNYIITVIPLLMTGGSTQTMRFSIWGHLRRSQSTLVRNMLLCLGQDTQQIILATKSPYPTCIQPRRPAPVEDTRFWPHVVEANCFNMPEQVWGYQQHPYERPQQWRVVFQRRGNKSFNRNSTSYRIGSEAH